MDTFFTSDTHFGHTNIIEYCDRPWRGSMEMDEGLIERWNDTVRPEDRVFHMGDFALGLQPDQILGILRRLNGSKFIIPGNHDERTIARRPSFFIGPGLFENIYLGMREQKVNGQRIIMCHFSMKVWNKSHHGAWHLYGHSHGGLKDDPNSLSMDVGVDAVPGYRPISFDEVAARMARKTFRPLDHHGAD